MPELTDDQYYYQYDIDSLNESKIATIVLGTFCSIFPLSVVFILLYRYEKLVKGKRLIHYILMIAIADTISSLCIAMGYPNSYSSTCNAQAFLVIFSSRISWFYTDVLVFELFYLIFLPLSSKSMYGNDDSQSGLTRCGLATGKGTPAAAAYWVFYTFQIELIISFVLIAIFSVITISYCYYMSRKDTANMYMLPKIRSTWSTLILYPLGMLIAWVPYALYAHYFNMYVVNNHHPPDNGLLVANYFHLSNALYGVILSFIFYTKTGDAITEWKLIFSGLFNTFSSDKRIIRKDNNVNEDSGSRQSSISIGDRPTVNVTNMSHQSSNNKAVSNPIINIA